MPQLTQEQFDALREKGLSDDKIKTLAEAKGYALPGEQAGVGGVVTGAVKGALEISRGTAQLLQGAGQRAIAAFTPLSLEEVREQTGFKSLDERKPEGAFVAEALEAKTTEEKIGKVAANVATFFTPTAKVTQVGGRVVKGAGEVITRAGIGISAKEAPLIQGYRAKHSLVERILASLQGKTLKAPVTNRQTALNKNLFGTETMIGVQARRGATNLWKQVIEPALDASKEKIKMSSFLDDVGKEVEKVIDPSRKRELQNAFNSLKDDFSDVGEITFKQLQEFKEGWAKFLPDKVYKGKPIAGAFREIQNIAASLARNRIYNAIGLEGKAAYFDYGNLKNLQELGQKALTQSKLKGGAGTFISGIKDMTLTPIASTGGLVLYKVGKGLEFIGTKGLKSVGQIFGL